MPTLTYGKVTCDATKGADLLGPLLDAGASIGYICMAGSCGTCRVSVKSGVEHLAPKTDSELMHLPGAPAEIRLACQATCLGTGDITISQP